MFHVFLIWCAVSSQVWFQKGGRFLDPLSGAVFTNIHKAAPQNKGQQTAPFSNQLGFGFGRVWKTLLSKPKVSKLSLKVSVAVSDKHGRVLPCSADDEPKIERGLGFLCRMESFIVGCEAWLFLFRGGVRRQMLAGG